MTIEVQGIAGLKELVGKDLGYSDWVEVTQMRVDDFANATGDRQWIHIDPERAKRESPFHGPIAHGYLTLSMGPALLPEIIDVTGVTMALNYGLDKVRFPAPVMVGSKLRMGATLDKVEDFEGGAQATMTLTFLCEDAPKPSCVATVIFRYYA